MNKLSTALTIGEFSKWNYDVEIFEVLLYIRALAIENSIAAW